MPISYHPGVTFLSLVVVACNPTARSITAAMALSQIGYRQRLSDGSNATDHGTSVGTSERSRGGGGRISTLSFSNEASSCEPSIFVRYFGVFDGGRRVGRII